MGSQGSKVHFDQNCYFSYRLHGMVMWLIYIYQLDTLYKSYRFKNSPGVIWGHWGQKVIFTKIAISPTDYMVWLCDSCIFINWIPSTKIIGLKIHPGSFGVTGVNTSFSPKMLFFRVHGMVMRLMHIDQLDTLYKSYQIKNSSGVTWGHRGQKVIFTKKRYFSNCLHGMDMWLMHIYQIDTIYRSNRSKNSSGVIWGHRGSKGHFHLKGYNSSMLPSMTIRHIHVYTLETLYLCYGVKFQPGVIWGLRGQKVIFTKTALTCLY